MAEINNGASDYVRFYLQSDLYNKTLMQVEPGNWNDDNLELSRSVNHGIFNKFSNPLQFFGSYRDFIEDTFEQLGNNSSLYLTKEVLREVGGDVVYIERYRGRADWETKNINNGVLSIRFNSNDIEEKLAANETDEIEIQTLTSIDGDDIDALETFKTSLNGRNISFIGRSVLDDLNNYNNGYYGNQFWFTPRSKLISVGNTRHSSIDSHLSNVFDSGDYGINDGAGSNVGYAILDKGQVASNMFFVDTTSTQATTFAKIKYKIKCNCNVPSSSREFKISIMVKKKNNGSGYTNIDEHVLHTVLVTPDNPADIDIEGEVIIEVPFDTGLVLTYKWFTLTLNTNVSNFYSFNTNVFQQDITVEGYTYQEPSLDLSFVFVHDVFERLSNIILNKKGFFYSKYFGRTELGYAQDGEGGLIGLMSGYWARAFNEDSEKYKSPVFSHEKLFDSCNAVFNIGLGVETVNGQKRLRAERVKYFYQNKIVVKLGRVTDINRDYDNKLYFSGVEIGYNKGGDYENEVGLDEPNVKTFFTTPDRKSKNKYRKISDIRSDDYGLEIVRRKPELLFSQEDTRGDSHNWFLDLKRAFNGKFEQKSWQDRLQSAPTGINDVESYRSFFFTPLRMLFRHGWILRSCLEKYLTKNIKYISSKSNTKLKTHYIDEVDSFQENLPDGLKVNKLERSRFLPEKIRFKRDVDDDLLDLIYGTTRVFFEGSYENIPNYYFKFEWINEKDEKETGFLMNLKPSSLGEFEMLKANERPINLGDVETSIDFNITQDNNFRVTQDNNFRITQ